MNILGKYKWEGIFIKKKQIIIITLFIIAITYIALYLQWSEFYKGYSYDKFNIIISIIFLLVWLLFSFYWGLLQEIKYRKFIISYWGINIISAIVIYFFSNNELIQSLLLPFYIWFGGPLYGFRYVFNSIDIHSLILVTSPLGILFSYIGYFIGRFVSNLK